MQTRELKTARGHMMPPLGLQDRHWDSIVNTFHTGVAMASKSHCLERNK